MLCHVHDYDKMKTGTRKCSKIKGFRHMKKKKSTSRSAYKNDFQKNHYDRVQIILKKGKKELLKGLCDRAGISMNEYITMLIDADLASGESSALLERKQGFTEEQKTMLKKWQVGEKYYSMIEDLSYSKEKGYFIYLKDGFINDVTGSRSIYCQKTAEVRKIINKCHPVYEETDQTEGMSSALVSWLKKWQIPAKYYSMVENAGKDDQGTWFLLLKEGFTNDQAGGRLIKADHANDVRSAVKYSHAV